MKNAVRRVQLESEMRREYLTSSDLDKTYYFWYAYLQGLARAKYISLVDLSKLNLLSETLRNDYKNENES